MNFIRWEIFKFLSWVGWWICPQHHRGNLKMIWGMKMDDFHEMVKIAKEEGIIVTQEREDDEV